MTDTATTFRVGDRVLYNGKPATVYAYSHLTGYLWVSGAGDYRLDGVHRDGRTVDESAPGNTLGDWVPRNHLTPLNKPATAPKTDAEPSADTEATSALTAQVAALTSQIHAMQDDVATIGEHLKRTANRHEWCDEYEEHLSRLLADLSEHTVKNLESAAKRTQSFFVDYSWSTMVEAVDAEQAERIGRERYESDGWDGEFTVSEAE